jgi:uncharacterized protein YbjT (DUF2867 family)
MVRNLEKAKDLATLPHCTVVKGDFEDEESLTAALVGVDRAMLVSSAGKHEQFDIEVGFIAAATAAGVKAIVRISTASFLIHPGSTGVYARAHACIAAYIDYHHSPVVDLDPNWYFDNIIGSAGEAKANGTISYPATGTGKSAMIDTRDVGSAAAAILLLDDAKIAQFLQARVIEVHGPELVSFNDNAVALSAAAGYPIRINQVSAKDFAGALMGFGLSKLFAYSFAHTVEGADGIGTPMSPYVQTTSPLLLSIWKPKHNLASWASQPYVVESFKK